MFSVNCDLRRLRLAAALVPAVLFLAGVSDAGRSAPLSDNDEVRESVVRVEVDNGKAIMQGTGFIINDRGIVATKRRSFK